MDVEILLYLLELDLRPLLGGVVQQKHQICRAAYEGHEFHDRRVAALQKLGIDPGQVVKAIVKRRYHTEVQLGPGRVSGQLPDRGRGKAQPEQQHRNRDDKFDRILHHLPAGKHRYRQQRNPTPQLAAQIGRQDGNYRP